MFGFQIAGFGIPLPPVAGSTNPILSVQNVTVTISGGNTTGATAITAVDVANSIILPGCYAGISSQTTGNNCWARWDFTDSGGDEITATRVGTTGDVTVEVTVVEFASGVLTHNNRTTMTITGTATSNTASLGATVTASRSCVIPMGFSITQTATNDQRRMPVIYRSSTTDMTAYVLTAPGSAQTLTVGFQAIEFSSSYVNNVQTIFYDATTSSTSIDVSITSVDTDRCICFFSGSHTSGSSVSFRQMAAELTNSTTMNFATNFNSSLQRRAAAVVIEFIDDTFLSQVENQSGSITSTNTTATDTITASTIGDTIVTYMGHYSGISSGSTPQAVCSSVKHDGTTNTTVNLARGDGVDVSGVTVKYRVQEAII